MQLANTIACIILIAWSIWSAFSVRINDGIIGKIIFSVLAVSALAVILSDQDQQPAASITVNLCLAAYAIRQVFLRYAWGLVLRCFGRPAPCRRHDDF